MIRYHCKSFTSGCWSDRLFLHNHPPSLLFHLMVYCSSNGYLGKKRDTIQTLRSLSYVSKVKYLGKKQQRNFRSWHFLAQKEIWYPLEIKKWWLYQSEISDKLFPRLKCNGLIQNRNSWSFPLQFIIKSMHRDLKIINNFYEFNRMRYHKMYKMNVLVRTAELWLRKLLKKTRWNPSRFWLFH